MEATSVQQQLPPPLLPNNGPSAAGSLREICQEPEDFLKVISTISEGVNSESVFKLPASETRPHDFYIAKRKFFIIQGEISRGVQSAAFRALGISLDDCSEEHLVIKYSKMSFRREVECLSLLTPESKKSPNIDHFKGVYNVCNEKESYIALFEEGCCDFCNIPYSEIKKPVSFALTQLISIGEGIASLHRSDLVHRDIKGKNLLVGCGEAPGKVTDFGMLQKCGPKGETHSTACTPFHAAPYIWSNILGQKYRTKSGQRKDEGGFQGKAADIFSLGRTIQYDVINSIIIHLCEKAEVDIKDLVRIFLFPRKFSGHISDKKLMAYETINPGYVFYMERTERQEEYILIFEKETEVYERTLKIIHLLEGCLEDLEYFKLVGLTALARDLQVTNKASLLGSFGLTEENQSDQLIQKVLERLRIIENKYCFRSPDFGRDSSFEEESTLDNGSPKRRKKETPERGEREVSVLAPETPKTELDFEPPKIEGDDF